MSDPAQIEQELREFLENEDNLRKADRLAYLMAIVNKHFAIDKIDHTMINYDFNEVVNNAKSAFAKTTMPIYISKKEISSYDVNYILVLEAFIGYLNKNKLLKRLVKLDYGR